MGEEWRTDHPDERRCRVYEMNIIGRVFAFYPGEVLHLYHHLVDSFSTRLLSK